MWSKKHELLLNVWVFLLQWTVNSKSMDTVRSLVSVFYAALIFFSQSPAQRLIEDKGAVDAVAAALACISDASSLNHIF